jgi:curved DNA-binding protein
MGEGMPRDYYLVLGVSREANLNKIKKAYRRAAKQYHPDMALTSESAEKFREIREAYETLGDERKRRSYDEELARRGSKLRITRAPDIIQQRRSVFEEVEDLFTPVDDFFSGFLPGFFDRPRQRQKDLYLEILLTPAEASQGGLFPVTVPVVEPCPRCGKTGLWEDFFCPTCFGYGRIRSERKFSLSIPPQVKQGTKIRLSMEDIGLKDCFVNISVYIETQQEDFW